MSLEERLFKSFDDQQKDENEVRENETLIKSFSGSSSLLPERKYGKPVEMELLKRSIVPKQNKMRLNFQLFWD